MITNSDIIDKIRAAQCKECRGGGMINDAEPGDISMNEHECQECKGCGFDLRKIGGLREMYEEMKSEFVRILFDSV